MLIFLWSLSCSCCISVVFIILFQKSSILVIVWLSIMPPKKSDIGRKNPKARKVQRQREQETVQQMEARRDDSRTRQAARRDVETAAQRDARLEAMRAKVPMSTIPRTATWMNEAYQYQPGKNYHLHKEVQIGTMSNGKPCSYCAAKKWAHESKGMCCFGGKVILPDFGTHPEPLKSLLDRTAPDSKHFLDNIRKYITNAFK